MSIIYCNKKQLLSHCDEKELYENLSESGKNRVKEGKTKARNQELLLGTALVEYLLQKEYQITKEEIQYQYSKLGKPSLRFLSDQQKQLFFSISHTKEMIAVAVTSYPIGIDLEQIGRVTQKIAQRFFWKRPQSTGAIDYLKQLEKDCGEQGKERVLTVLWCEREALVKLKDVPFQRICSEIEVHSNPLELLDEPQQIVLLDGTKVFLLGKEISGHILVWVMPKLQEISIKFIDKL